MPKERLDKLLVARDLAPTREQAQALIMAGKVRVDDIPALKAGSRVAQPALHGGGRPTGLGGRVGSSR